MVELSILIGSIILLEVYVYMWRPRQCKKRLRQYVAELDGSVLKMERISIREEIYVLTYQIGMKAYHTTVKFGIFYDMTFA